MKKIKQPRLFPIVIPYGRNTYLVVSDTRNDITHLVDLEGYGKERVICTCEAFIMGHQRPCKHIKSLIISI